MTKHGRYEARDGTGVYAGWEVVEIIEPLTTRYVVPTCDRTEAEAIAWMLNALAEQKTVVKLTPPGPNGSGIQYAGYYCEEFVRDNCP